jgi:hypothetical protein
MKRTIVTLTDDLDGTDAAETLRFALDDATYEIDLNEPNAKAVREFLAPYVAAGRKMFAATRPARRSRNRADTTAIRIWAKSVGLPVNERGRIPAEITTAYRSAQQPGPVPPEPAPSAAQEPADGPGSGAAPDGTQEPADGPDPGARTMAPDATERTVIRAWAALRGIKLNARGRIPANVIAEYDATHGAK